MLCVLLVHVCARVCCCGVCACVHVCESLNRQAVRCRFSLHDFVGLLMHWQCCTGPCCLMPYRTCSPFPLHLSSSTMPLSTAMGIFSMLFRCGMRVVVHAHVSECMFRSKHASAPNAHLCFDFVVHCAASAGKSPGRAWQGTCASTAAARCRFNGHAACNED